MNSRFKSLVPGKIMTESEEARLRQKAILIIARRQSSYAWKRVTNRLIRCISIIIQ